MLASCGADATESATSNQSDVAAEGESTTSTIKIGNLEVMTENLGDMSWDEANIACVKVGDGWRLPTKDELKILYENKDKIGGFANGYYWSSTETGNDDAWGQYFLNGVQSFGIKGNGCDVRAIRAF